MKKIYIFLLTIFISSSLFSQEINETFKICDLPIVIEDTIIYRNKETSAINKILYINYEKNLEFVNEFHENGKIKVTGQKINSNNYSFGNFNYFDTNGNLIKSETLDKFKISVCEAFQIARTYGISTEKVSISLKSFENSEKIESYLIGESESGENHEKFNGIEINVETGNIKPYFFEILEQPLFTDDKYSILPEFPGGFKEYRNYLIENSKFPIGGDLKNRVFVSFTVDTIGKISNISINRSLNDSFNEEAIRLISMMPNWNPALDKNGRKVISEYICLIDFE